MCVWSTLVWMIDCSISVDWLFGLLDVGWLLDQLVGCIGCVWLVGCLLVNLTVRWLVDGPLIGQLLRLGWLIVCLVWFKLQNWLVECNLIWLVGWISASIDGSVCCWLIGCMANYRYVWLDVIAWELSGRMDGCGLLVVWLFGLGVVVCSDGLSQMCWFLAVGWLLSLLVDNLLVDGIGGNLLVKWSVMVLVACSFVVSLVCVVVLTGCLVAGWLFGTLLLLVGCLFGHWSIIW